MPRRNVHTHSCDFRHRLASLLRSSLGEMIRRSIAAIILTVLCGSGTPAAFGFLSMGALHHVQRVPSSAHDHSCCPGTHSRFAPALTLSASPMPCGMEHRCCIRQAPAGPSTLPVESKVFRPAGSRTRTAVLDQPPIGRDHITEISVINCLPPPSERSAVLRI